MSLAFWRGRPGLAGGIDKDGSRAAELLAAGFGSVEFGTVATLPEPGRQPGVAALVARLSALDRRPADAAKIGIGIGAGIAPEVDPVPPDLAADWLAAMRAAWYVADYLCFNLSARAYRPLLGAEHAARVANAIAALARERERLAALTGRRLPLALKIPLGAGDEPWPAAIDAAADAGLDALVAVLPEDGDRLRRLRALAARRRGRPALVAVGGLRTADDVRAALAAGADGIQVHRAFVDHGAGCLPALLEGMSAGAGRIAATGACPPGR